MQLQIVLLNGAFVKLSEVFSHLTTLAEVIDIHYVEKIDV